MMFNEAIIHILKNIIVGIIPLLFTIYDNNLSSSHLFDLLLCAILFLITLHSYLLLTLLLCYPAPPSLDHQTLLLLFIPSSCTCLYIQCKIYSLAPPAYPVPPISPHPGDCPKSSYSMSPLHVFSKTTSSPSSTFPSLTYFSIIY